MAIIVPIASQGSYSKHFIFFVTCAWAQKVRVFYYTKLERLTRDKDSSLLDPFVSNKENEVF
jgi:hypothetical protein